MTLTGEIDLTITGLQPISNAIKKITDVNTFVFDMDGTLLNDTHEISALNVHALNKLQARGFNVVIATGRHFNDLRHYLQQLGGNIATITCNGANIHDRNGELIYRQGLSFAVNDALLPLAEEFDVHLNMFTDTEWLVTAPNEFMLDAHDQGQFIYRQVSLQEMRATPALKILFYGTNAKLQQLKTKILDEYSLDIHLTFSDECYLEVMKTNISKGHALTLLLDKLGLPINRTMAFGDGMNDVELFETVTHPIIMENASATLQQLFPQARRAQPNYQEGVARFLLDYVL